jgi:putative hemolysin
MKNKFVDVRSIIKSRNPSALKWLPAFFISWIEGVIHQEDVNNFMQKHANASTLEFCQAAVEEFDLDLTIDGKQNIPAPHEPVIFVANHPLGGLDAIAMIHLLRDVRADLIFIVNDFLLAIENLKDRFIGVNKLGKNAVNSLQRVEEEFEKGKSTFLFPAGLVSRKIEGEIRDLEWKKTFVTKAKKYNKAVIPIYIEGRLTERFYRLAKIRKLLGLKFNIEMFFLVDELYRQKGTHISIKIGQPISPSSFTKEKSDKEWAAWVKEGVYQLKN